MRKMRREPGHVEAENDSVTLKYAICRYVAKPNYLP